MKQQTVVFPARYEDQELQDVTTISRSDEKLNSPWGSRTSTNVNPILDNDKIDYIKRDIAYTKTRTFFRNKNGIGTLKLDSDFLDKQFGSKFWNVALMPIFKNVELCKTTNNVEFYIKKFTDEDYSYLLPELGMLRNSDLEFSLRAANILEEAINVSKLEQSDPFQKRTLEDLQWDLIELKRALLDIHEERRVKSAQNARKVIVNRLEKKMNQLYLIKNAFHEIGIDEKEILKFSSLKQLPSRRVEITWIKSGSEKVTPRK